MKKFLFKTCLILFIGFILNILFFNIANINYYEKYNRDIIREDACSSILLSDSHGNSLDDDTYKYGVTNMAFPSDNYIDMYRKLLLIIDRYQIDTILITAEEHTLSSYRERSNNNDRSYIYKENINYLSFDFLSKYIIIPNSKSHEFVKNFIGGLINKKVNLLFKFSNNYKHFEEKKWLDLKKSEKENYAQKRFNGQYKNHIISKKLLKSLLKIIEICKKNNICMIGIKFPLTSELNDIMLFNENPNKIDESSIYYNNMYYESQLIVDSIYNANNLRILDFKDIYINRDNIFENSDHLNKLGANEFNIKLSQYLNRRYNN